MGKGAAWFVTAFAVQVKMAKEDCRCWLSYFELMKRTMPEFWFVYPIGDHRRN